MSILYTPEELVFCKFCYEYTPEEHVFIASFVTNSLSSLFVFLFCYDQNHYLCRREGANCKISVTWMHNRVQ
jgi:hypothetical protein